MGKFAFGKLLCLIFFAGQALGQTNPVTDSLQRELEKTSSVERKVFLLGRIALAYTAVDNAKAEAFAAKQLETAELSRDRELMIQALLANTGRCMEMSANQESVNRAQQFAGKALAIAKNSQNNRYTAYSYIQLARCARINGETDKALNYNNHALVLSNELKDDSLKVMAHLSIGNTYLVRQERLLAFSNYLNAKTLADETSNYDLIRSVYSQLATFYSDLDDHEKAKDFLFKLTSLSFSKGKPSDRLDFYNRIGRIYSEQKQFDLATHFFEKIIRLADTLRYKTFEVIGYGAIIDMYLSNEQAGKALEYIQNKPAVGNFMNNAGMGYFLDNVYALAYHNLGKPDSAKYYYEKAEPQFMSKANRGNQFYFLGNYAQHFYEVGDYERSIQYWNKAMKIAEGSKSIAWLQMSAKSLDSVYQKKGDYRNAHLYNSLYFQYKDSLETLSKEKDLMALELEDENRRKEREAKLLEEQKRKSHNLQYMGITVAIAAVFILLVMLGIFSVSKTTIKIMGFFAFIFLFEFIILLADNKIHHWTHGEPWKVLGIKIALIAILLPLHHFLEEKVIHYLTSKKMLQVNRRNLLSRLRSGGKKTAGSLHEA